MDDKSDKLIKEQRERDAFAFAELLRDIYLEKKQIEKAISNITDRPGLMEIIKSK